MWGRVIADFQNGYSGYKTGPDLPPTGWVPGAEAVWRAAAVSASGRSNYGRRLSAASDSGDTGIGTSCSDSVEDHSSPSGTLSFKPIRSQITIPTAHVMPSTSSSLHSKHREPYGSDCSRCLTLPGRSRNVDFAGPTLDMKDPRPVRKWSSLTKLTGSATSSPDNKPGRAEAQLRGDEFSHNNTDPFRYRINGLDLLSHSMEHLSTEDKELNKRPVASDPKYKFASYDKRDPSTLMPSHVKNALDLTYSALPESKSAVVSSEGYGQRCLPLGHQTVDGLPIQASLRTQMWLTEQMHTNALDFRPAEGSCVLTAWHPQQQSERLRQGAECMQIPSGSPRQVSPVYPTVVHQDLSKWESLLKVKEGLLRQKEMVIDRQKQQISQLHQKIRENELRAQQMILGQRGPCEDTYMLYLRESQLDSSSLQASLSDRVKALLCEKDELEHKLAAAELEVSQLNHLKETAQKSSEEIKKLEEKVKTRDKYITSLKKKCQKESEQNQEKQRRIETLEKYLADLPTLDDVQNQSRQLTTLEEQNKQLREAISDLEKNLGESRALCQEKEALLEHQEKKEKELVTTVQSLQQKVEKCLEDGVRLPMLDMKQLQSENDCLKEHYERATKVIDNQQKQIDRLTMEMQVLQQTLTLEKGATQELRKEITERDRSIQQLNELVLENQRHSDENSQLQEQLQESEQSRQPLCEKTTMEQLFKEMSLCLSDLKALCSILTQQAQGKEPNLTLLLGIRSMSCSAEESENYHSAEMLAEKFSDVCQLRKDIDELRTIISDRYAQDMGDNCITQ
ncbi:centrosomal protein of 85 kDa-like isoform X2 [Latimeria chalumnae]|uniref:Centrosomal protein 85 like n=1 Tax=Latimeria chalumnae TaxID=7897 RepID=H3AKI8_LATCH|nr:PREDICTED: centrosomal protein of 85 kDa-like isoform X2 [Latimeria chalumnae]|eukprot:XP_014346221.1 PREDICTED: centrosomal protein of 85 kDa-like isoform X2 [Latimeria chalumnae]